MCVQRLHLRITQRIVVQTQRVHCSNKTIIPRIVADVHLLLEDMRRGAVVKRHGQHTVDVETHSSAIHHVNNMNLLTNRYLPIRIQLRIVQIRIARRRYNHKERVVSCVEPDRRRAMTVRITDVQHVPIRSGEALINSNHE